MQEGIVWPGRRSLNTSFLVRNGTLGVRGSVLNRNTEKLHLFYIATTELTESDNLLESYSISF